MDFKKTMLIWMALMLSLSASAVGKLNMFIEMNRFMDSSGNTILNIDYQIPYKNMVFTSKKGAFFAELDISISVSKKDSLIYQRTFQDNIGIRNKHDVTDTGKTYLNRISFLLGEGEHGIKFEAYDTNAQSKFVWIDLVKPFQAKSLLSDIEICSSVKVDSTAYLEKFKRGNTLYKTEPSMLFAKDILEEVVLYYEIYTPEVDPNQAITIVLMLEYGDEIILDQLFEVKPGARISGRSLKIPLDQLSPGLHFGSITAYYDSLVDSRSFEFVVTEKTAQLYFVFPDPEDEYNLMKYFIASRLPSSWKSMDKESKRRYISQFWQVMAGSYGLGIDEMMDTINQRIQYVNKFYSHFSPGWTTDMGRIYLKNGAPDDIDKEQTSDDTKFVRKDFQIWRYTQKRNALYVFIDIQMNGNYRLIYVDNDDTEASNPDWQRYLGTEFDTTKLRN